MQNRRELFEFRRGGFHVSVALRGRIGTPRYVGCIDGEERVYASGKGDLMRRLLELTSNRPAT